MNSRLAVKFGIEVLRDEGFARLKGKRVGLMTNPSAVDAKIVSTYRILWEAPEVNLVALYSPEHGLASAEVAGEKVGSAVDPRTGLPIHSLYGETLRPTAEMLGGLDVLVCDIQDVGARFYTYTWTISHILEACGEHGVEVLILDRPNPLGNDVQGPGLEPELASFVGRFNIPIRHGMTLGELAQMINGQWNPTPCKLDVVCCVGWSRHTKWPETGRVWVTPSPAMPTYETAEHYPGACLVEGTNLSEGRGTALPFQVVGAPFIDAERLADQLNGLNYAGVAFRPHIFKPTASKWDGQTCGGVQVHILRRDLWQPIEVWLAVIQAIKTMYAQAFAWNTAHFDRLIGSAVVRNQIEAGTALNEITASWKTANDAFRQQRTPFLLYEEREADS